MANTELCKLLSLDDPENKSMINQRLQQKIFKPYDYISGIGDSSSGSRRSSDAKMDLFETLNPDTPSIFEVQTSYDFQNDRLMEGNSEECKEVVQIKT